MTNGLERIEQLPEPPGGGSLEELWEYIQKLHKKLQEAQTGRLEDFDVTKLRNVPWVDVRKYGTGELKQNGFAKAISVIGSTETTLLVSNQQNVTDNVTVPATLTLWFTQGGSLNISSGKTVTINGRVDAGLYQIFEGSGVISLASGLVKTIYPEWWGAVSDGSTDDSTPIQSAITALAISHGVIKFIPDSSYYASDLLVPANTSIILEGRNTTLKLKNNALANYLQVAGGDVDCEFRGFICDGNKANQDPLNIHFFHFESQTKRIVVDHCHFLNGKHTDINVETDWDAVIKNCYFESNDYENIRLHATHRCTVKDSTFINPNNAGIFIDGMDNTIDNCHFFDIKNGKKGIRFSYDASNLCKHNTIRNCRFLGESGATTAEGINIETTGNTAFNSIIDCTFKELRQALQGILKYWKIEGNLFDDIKNYAFLMPSTDYNVFKGNIFQNSVGGIKFNGNCDYNIVIGNVFESLSVGIYDDHDPNVNNSNIAIGNIFKNCTIDILDNHTDRRKKIVAIANIAEQNPKDPRIVFDTAVPGSGTWRRGDICFRTNATAGEPLGWICVTAGTSGTWKAMANLAA